MKYVTEEDARRNRAELCLPADNGSWASYHLQY